MNFKELFKLLNRLVDAVEAIAEQQKPKPRGRPPSKKTDDE